MTQKTAKTILVHELYLTHKTTNVLIDSLINHLINLLQSSYYYFILNFSINLY